MKRTLIDRETVQKIIDTADIVEVVSDFVHLKRRGANYIGLCPFHNERTPSFSVSRAKGICKCFSCGKGGSAVSFIMEHEQLTYWEALRYLAKKYHIEIQEHEMTDDERREQTERQGMMAVNEFAMAHFEKNMLETPDGKEIGLAYFRERGINDWAISRFHLGYSLDRRDDLLNAAKGAGYNEKYLVDTGLCVRNDKGYVYDRFKARVMFPVFTISGKVVAFGGRTLRKDKEVAKYVNSPESLVYSKSRELYGLYQAKQSIVKKDKCILVEGYMDVISMHQNGVENVVASSGTSLTDGQIRLIHRFTDNVTVIYDSDPAGIKASLRGIDMLLAEGLDIKVLLLPDGDDPDSFAQSHSSTEVEQYLADNEVDFIRFKTDILLKDCADDPIRRSKVIGDIVRSIAVIPIEIKRQVYIQECSLRFGIDEMVLTRQVNKDIAAQRETDAVARQRRAAVESIDNSSAGQTEAVVDDNIPVGQNVVATEGRSEVEIALNSELGNKPDVEQLSLTERHRAAVLEPQERALLRLVLKYGMLDLGEDFGADEDGRLIKVIDFVAEDLAQDDMSFTNSLYRRVFSEAIELRNSAWTGDEEAFMKQAIANREAAMRAGIAEIQQTATDMADITGREQRLAERCEQDYRDEMRRFALNYFERNLASHPDDAIRRLTTDLVVDKHQLSKIYFKNNTKVETEEDRLNELVPRALVALKYDMARCYFDELRLKIKQLQSQPDYDLQEILSLMATQKRWQEFCAALAGRIGERVYEPLR